jgi:hypothetical protein
MILLLSVSPLGQAGVKRLHPRFGRIRRQKTRSGSFAPLNKQDLSLSIAFTAFPHLKSGQPRLTGLKFKPMYNRGKLHPNLLAASQGGTCTFSVETKFPQSLCPELQSRCVVFVKDKQTSEMPEGDRVPWARSGRSFGFSAVSLRTVPAAVFLRKRLLAKIRTLNDPCFSLVARQPQQPVVQAPKKI